MSEAKLVEPRRTASVIVTIGVGNASKIYEYLGEGGVEQLTFEIARLDQPTAQDVGDTPDSFYQVYLTRKVVTESGIGYTRNVLEKACGPQMASSLLERVTYSLKTKVFELIRKADYKSIIVVIQNEYPQTIALTLSCTSTDRAAGVIGGLPKDIRLEVVERIATMDWTSSEIVKIVGQDLEKKFSSLMSLGFTEIGGVSYIANIMNSMDRANEKYIFGGLTRKDAALYEEIRRRMFVFEDITALDDMFIQHFPREVDPKGLVFALKGANKEVTETIFKNMSTRFSESVRSDPEYVHNIRLHSVKEAQQHTIGTICRLEGEGELMIVKGGKDRSIV